MLSRSTQQEWVSGLTENAEWGIVFTAEIHIILPRRDETVQDSSNTKNVNCVHSTELKRMLYYKYTRLC